MLDKRQLAHIARISELLKKYLHENISDDELNELHNWAYSNKDNQDIFENIRNRDEFEEAEQFFAQIDEEAAFRSIEDKLIPIARKAEVVNLPVDEPIRINRWRYLTAAAIAVLIAGLATIYFTTHGKTDHTPLQTAQVLKHDAAPGGNKAVLTLANGNTIILDKAENGTLAQQGNTKVLKLSSGKLAYTAVNRTTPETTDYNTLSTPRGGQYQVVLPDGTKAWLNASSTLRYPTAFTGKERVVELSGEGYFEVARSMSKPFKVKVNDLTVNVLGTHFNIMAYPDEALVKTTLLSGSIKVVQGNQGKLLTPGEQAQVSTDGKLNVIKDESTSDEIAWKNGFFYFKRANIQTVMRQLARWYDVEVKYEGDVPAHQPFMGKIQKNLTLSQVLELLEINNVNFKIEGKTLTLLP